MDLKEMESGVDPKVHWYYQSKKIPLFKYFKQVARQLNTKINVVDFGSGSGFFAYELYEAFPELIEQVYLVDIGYDESELLETAGKPIQKLHSIPTGLSNCIVIMMDVLEHIENDQAVLQDIHDKVGENSFYFITVPAFMSVWSAHDVYLGHYRRYTLPTLTKLLNACSCKIDQKYYIYGAIFPLVWAVRRIKRNEENMADPDSSDMSSMPGPVNFVLKAYNSFEMNFRKLNKLFGLTCVSEGRFPK
ncbi:MAG: methyltransferase domain-containing protein [Bacteroidota bacterium]